MKKFLLMMIAVVHSMNIALAANDEQKNSLSCECRHYDEMSLAEGMKTKPYPIGSNPKDMAKFFENIGWYVDSSLNHNQFTNYEKFKNWVIKNLNEQTPIMVENVEWGGHWRVIIGYDTMGTENTLDDVLIMVDSYDTSDHDQDGYVVNNGDRFFSMWFDHSMLPKKKKSGMDNNPTLNTLVLK